MREAVRSAIAADSRSAGKQTEIVKQHNRTSIAYIAGRLITGKRIASLYDFNNLTHIEIDHLPNADCLQKIGGTYKDYVKGSESKYKCLYHFEENHAIDLSINGRTFMGRITGSNAYFIGNVRDNSIHIYDHEDALHLNYRISGCMVVPGSGVICKSCWTPKYESAAGVLG